MVTCQFCGTANRAQATYCNTCGGALDGTALPHAAASAGAATASATHATGRLPPHALLDGHYHMVKAVGQGGMAAVYQAADTRSNRIVAIKEMSQDGLTPDEVKEAIANFRFEADTLTRLRHPNLPRVYERFSVGARHYLAIEYVDGQTLEQRLQAAGGKPLPEVEVMGWARQLCAVLGYLHSQHPPIIFRDLKPANIMVTARDEVKLVDFGIARVFAPGRTRDTQILGTPGYAPPEQYGKAQTDPRADVYALGCTLYQLLSAYDPATTPFALPPLHTRNPAISPHIERAIARATQLNRDDRFLDMASFGAALLQPPGLIFFAGACARTPTELLALCRQQPDEAADHLYYGRIEAWLRLWGAKALAAQAATARASSPDRAAALAAFLAHAGRAPSAAQSPWVSSTAALVKWLAATAAAARAKPSGGAAPMAGTTAAPHAAPHQTRTLAEVQPRSVFFGRLVAGQRGVYAITISGQNGARVSGAIRSLTPWISVDHDRFDAPSTVVQLTAETGKIASTGIHQATIQITCAGRQVYLPATADIAPVTSAAAAAGRPAATRATATAPARRSTPAKYSAIAPRRSRMAGFLMALVLAFALAAGALMLASRALAAWAPQLVLAAPARAGLLLIATVGAIIGALAGTGGSQYGARWRTALAGAIAGLVTFAMTGGIVVLSARAVPTRPAVSPAHPALLLGLALVSVGAAVGAEPNCSRIMHVIARFVARRAAFFVPLSLIVLGAVAGSMALASVFGGALAPFGLVGGAIIGGMLASSVRRWLRTRLPPVPRVARVRP